MKTILLTGIMVLLTTTLFSQATLSKKFNTSAGISLSTTLNG